MKKGGPQESSVQGQQESLDQGRPVSIGSQSKIETGKTMLVEQEKTLFHIGGLFPKRKRHQRKGSKRNKIR
jgi:hypothetical protein